MATETKATTEQTAAQPASSGPSARPAATPVLNPERLKTSIEEIKAMGGPPPWNKTLVRNDRLTATFIYQLPDTKNDHHYHLEDEWWYIAEGELAWEMEGHPEPSRVKAGDFVFAPANRYHLIHVLGDQPAIRIGFS